MSRYSFSLSPAYVARGAGDAAASLATSRAELPLLTLFSAVTLASVIFALVWIG
jgi:hypothetical protein